MNADQRSARFLEQDRLQRLLDALTETGYDIIGPTIDQQAVVYRSIRTVD